MSAQGNLQRPRSASWKVEAIRRGNLKISGPIPIEEDTPLNDEEEREFAERRGDMRPEEAFDVHAHTIRQVPNSQATLRQEDATEETAMKTDPGLLHKSQTAPQEPPIPNAQRISNLTVKELQPPHPLGQHLPYPMNVNAPPASPPHEYLRFDFQRPDPSTRRATLPNLPGDVAQRHSLDEPRGRLSTWEEKTEDEPLPSPGIGIALSGPSHAARTSLGDRRRSRSAGALRELAKARFSNDNSTTRNDVIKTWRESYASASVYSQNTRPQTARTVETVRSVHTKGPSVQEVESIHEGMSATLVGPDELTPNEPTPTAQTPSTPEPASRAQNWATPEHPPVSAFNFGNLEPSSPHEHKETLAQLEGPPVPSRSPKRLSVEERVQNLEDNIHSLESSIRRISTHNSRQTIILENAPRNLRTRTRSTSRSVSVVSVHQREPLPASQSSNLAYESSPPSPPLTHSDEKPTKEDLAPLHALLSEERTARLALESRVLALQNEVSALHDLVNKLVNRSTVAATSPNYPTPSPDSIHRSSEDMLPTPRAGRYEARRQGTEDSDVASPEVWATPKEEAFGGLSNRSGFFHSGEAMPQSNGVH
ncbi:hypothetical protein N0V95_000035 [Ascochyta clinopodiicola]|nr:hypothetical protein N0V95_000035 [Ascochyta clinopodiicola]